MCVDMHTHTTASDGILSPTALVEQASRQGLTGIAITDHDTLEGVQEGTRQAAACHILFVPGIELSCQWQDRELHILGYWPDTNSEELMESLKTLQKAREIRASKIIAKLNQSGRTITEKRVRQLSRGGSMGRPHIAMALVEKGYASSIQDAFYSYLNTGGSAYVPRYKVSPIEAISLICRAGGVPVFAHPITASADVLLPELREAGLRGIEVYHPHHNANTERYYAALAESYGLLATGGSDFHNEGLGSRTCSKKTVTELAKYRQI